MKCYILKDGEKFNSTITPKETISEELEKEIDEFCIKWQVRNLSEKGNSQYDDGIDYRKLYESLNPENFVIYNGKILGYLANHFDTSAYVSFSDKKDKYKINSYDFSDYNGVTYKVDRGFIDIVPNPDKDNNPYYDQPRFHSQAEYDDYIKWRD